jgi:transglutaminase-like putative cysteine protease
MAPNDHFSQNSSPASRARIGAGINGRTMDNYLRSTDVIDWQQADVLCLAKRLTSSTPEATAKRCFEWVRDQIRHSLDHRLNPVTCSASEVLQARTGYCYAKSHLLAALLRANAIPAAMCYQRLNIDGAGSAFCLHGLNAVYLPDVGWYRVDARGNKAGVDASFSPPTERLAFGPELPGERDLPGIFSDPLPEVIFTLRTYKTFDAVANHLPDVAGAEPF